MTARVTWTRKSKSFTARPSATPETNFDKNLIMEVFL